jgi:TolA-binding protein
MYLQTRVALRWFLLVMLTTRVGISQQPEPNALAALYQSARASYADRQFQKSASQFREVADRCAGSELAVQCEYFAVMSEWAIDPCDGCAAKLSNWLSNAKKFQEDSVAAGRSLDLKQLLKWTENAELIHAKWDRQKQRFELAENRLRSFLGVTEPDLKAIKKSPRAWLELGSLLLEHRQDYATARECFEKVIQDTKETESTHCPALLGCALTCWYSQQYAEVRVFLDRLASQKLDEETQLQVELLKVRVAKALGESIDVVEALDPVIRIALASNPPATVLYELAMALIESGEKSTSNELLLKLVHQFPNSPVSIEARVRLAHNASEKKQWKQAAEWSGQALDGGCSSVLKPYACFLRGQANLELGVLDKAKLDFEAALANPLGDHQLEITLRFQLSETLYQQQNWQDAEPYWKWLRQTAESSDERAGRPDWYPIVLLRSAELLALKKEWKQAEEMVLRIHNDFPKCNRACEVDYLLARCLVSKADFDAARQVLVSLIQPTNSTPDELVARGRWMIGETYLMQRKYSDALLAYRDVLQMPKQEYWSAASLLQIAECCAALHDPQGSKDAYETIINQFSQSPFVLTAKERLSKISSPIIANQPAKEPSGTKR